MSKQEDFSRDLSIGVRSILRQLSELSADPEHLDLQEIADCVEALFEEIGSEDVGEIVADAVGQGFLSQAQGNKAIEVSMWSGRTNGAQLNVTVERWLEKGCDPIRIELALAQDAFPFASQTRMIDVLTAIADQHPQFAPTINGMIERRRAQGV